MTPAARSHPSEPIVCDPPAAAWRFALLAPRLQARSFQPCSAYSSRRATTGSPSLGMCRRGTSPSSSSTPPISRRRPSSSVGRRRRRQQQRPGRVAGEYRRGGRRGEQQRRQRRRRGRGRRRATCTRLTGCFEYQKVWGGERGEVRWVMDVSPPVLCRPVARAYPMAEMAATCSASLARSLSLHVGLNEETSLFRAFR